MKATRPRTSCNGSRLALVAPVLISAGLSWSAVALAVDPSVRADATESDRDRARELMRAGTAEYKKGNFERARVVFQQVWALEHHPAVAASLGDVELRLGLYRDAATHWSYYLAKAPPERDRSEAEAALGECRRHVGSVRLSVDASGSEIYVDGKTIGKSPIDSDVWLDPGVHEIEARAADGRTAKEQIAIKVGESRGLALVLVSVAPPAPTPSPPLTSTPQAPSPPRVERSKESPASSLRVPVVITGSLLTAAAVAIGIVYSRKESQARDDVTRQLGEVDDATTDTHLRSTHGGCTRLASPQPQACSALSDSVGSVVTNQNIKTTAFISAGILGAATIVTYFLWPKPVSDRAARADIALVPWTESGHGVQLRLGF